MKEALEGFLKGGKGSEVGSGAPPPSFDLGSDSEEDMAEEGSEGENPLLSSIQSKLETATDAQLAEIDKILSGGKGGGMPPMPMKPGEGMM